MAKIAYISKKFRGKTAKLLQKINVVIENYENKGYRLTLRQLYYQLVSRNIIPNSIREYQKLSRTMTDARMTGLIDWDIIEDRIRIPKMPSDFQNISELVKAAIQSYRLDRWEDQDNYVEVWVEKDALSGVLEPITRKYHVSLLVNRGYSSSSAMHDAAIRIRNQNSFDKNSIVLYLGDHDPSGEDMVRDIQERLRIFGCSVEVKKIALTMEQVEQYQLPPNPAKRSDPRSENYITKYGDESWELDALTPEVLNELVVMNIENLLDLDAYEAVIQKEEEEKVKLVQFSKDL